MKLDLAGVEGVLALCQVEHYQEPAAPIIESKSIQEDSPLYTLPTEVLEIIIKNLDGKSVISLACTCARFYNVVQQVATWDKYFFEASKNTPHILDLGIHFGFPLWSLSPYSEVHKPVDECALNYPWKQIYICSQLWSSVNKWDFYPAFSNEIEMDDITSMSIAGQSIVFGTKKGGLGLWNPDRNPCIQPIKRFRTQVDQVIVQLCQGCDVQNWSHQIICHCVDTSLFIYDMEERKIKKFRPFNTDLKRISCNGATVFEYDACRGNGAETIITKNFVERSEGNHKFQVPFGPFVAVDIVEKLFISQKRGPLLVETCKLQLEQLLDGDDNLLISRAYIWPGQISFSITAGFLTIISVGHHCRKIQWPIGLKCTCAALFGNVFLIGTNTGRVLFYTFTDPEELLNLDPNGFKQIIETGTSETLFYVGVRIQNHIHQLPDVVAATRRKIFCFRVQDSCH